MKPTDWAMVLLPVFLISGLGVTMMWFHYSSRKADAETDHDELEMRHLATRYRRRMQASGILVLLGGMISGGQFLDGQAMPGFFGLYWLFVLFMTFWVILLALGDAASTLSYSKVAQNKLKQQRQEIEKEFERLKAQQGNGHPRTNKKPPPAENSSTEE
ncbi:MAG: hypothetical protein HUJ26_09475 [Planctomycetaceae bacterium]|nr:hypothetical protein [Planctomycetaceae bacterium]